MTSPLDQKKIKITGPVVVTANRVDDGAVVYRVADGGWTTDLDGAAVATSMPTVRGPLAGGGGRRPPRGRRLYRAGASCRPDGNVRPGNLRELIRSRRPDHRSACAARIVS